MTSMSLEFTKIIKLYMYHTYIGLGVAASVLSSSMSRRFCLSWSLFVEVVFVFSEFDDVFIRQFIECTCTS